MYKKSLLLILALSFLLLGARYSSIQHSWLYDGSGNAIGSLNGSLNVHDAHTHTRIINRHFLDFDSATENPSSAITAGDVTILVADTTGFAAGNHMVIRDAGGDVREHCFLITAVVVNTSITVDRPIGIAYTTSATLEKVLINMNVAGSLSVPLIYEIKPPSDEVWHITRIILSITDQTAMDDSLFGGIAALANGAAIIEEKAENYTITTWRTNQTIIEDMYDITYSDKAPAGFYGLRGRMTFTNADAVVRLDGALGDSLAVYIQDDLTNLDSFRIKAQGHIEE